jgi:parallel beta-helix repeat protein
MKGIRDIGLYGSILAALFIIFCFSTSPLQAAPIKITQAKAQNGNVTPGDTPGYPITISRSGSYVLDGNLGVPPNSDGIMITAANVNLDLAGFTIQGAGGNLGIGILAVGNIINITVINGIVTQMGQDGIHVTVQNSRIEGITSYANGRRGIYLGDGATVTGNNSSNNGEAGISVDMNSVVTDNTVSHNITDGILASGGTIARNTVAENTRGIVILGHNTLVISNTVERNAGIGIQFGMNGGGYRDNVINSNLGGTVQGGKNMGGNLCNQNTTCP